MSEYDQFGKPVIPDENIFSAPPVEAESTPKSDNRDALQKAAAYFHKPPEGNEPDWNGMLLNAQTMTEKFKIRAARDAYQEEQKFIHLQQVQAAEQARITEVLKSPLRNKQFYENLKQTDGRAYFSVEVQRQMKADKQQMGLAFHLKNPK